MSKLITKNKKALMLLSKANPKTVKKIILSANKSLISALSEICFNFLRGNIPLSPTHRRKIKKYRKNIKTLAGRGALKSKRQVLQRGGFLTTLLGIAAPLLFKGISGLVQYIRRKKAARKGQTAQRK